MCRAKQESAGVRDLAVTSQGCEIGQSLLRDVFGVRRSGAEGTKFDVHYGPQAVRVAVVEGRVEVSGKDRHTGPSEALQKPDAVVLTAGEAAVSEPTGQICHPNNVNAEDLGAWRRGLSLRGCPPSCARCSRGIRSAVPAVAEHQAPL